jgi:hypothetical protein
MPLDIDLDNLPPFPKRIPEKLKAIRERLKFDADRDRAARWREKRFRDRSV